MDADLQARTAAWLGALADGFRRASEDETSVALANWLDNVAASAVPAPDADTFGRRMAEALATFTKDLAGVLELDLSVTGHAPALYATALQLEPVVPVSVGGPSDRQIDMALNVIDGAAVDDDDAPYAPERRARFRRTLLGLRGYARDEEAIFAIREHVEALRDGSEDDDLLATYERILAILGGTP